MTPILLMQPCWENLLPMSIQIPVFGLELGSSTPHVQFLFLLHGLLDWVLLQSTASWQSYRTKFYSSLSRLEKIINIRSHFLFNLKQTNLKNRFMFLITSQKESITNWSLSSGIRRLLTSSNSSCKCKQQISYASLSISMKCLILLGDLDVQQKHDILHWRSYGVTN